VTDRERYAAAACAFLCAYAELGAVADGSPFLDLVRDMAAAAAEWCAAGGLEP
jgi:hypothetical protein